MIRKKTAASFHSQRILSTYLSTYCESRTLLYGGAVKLLYLQFVNYSAMVCTARRPLTETASLRKPAAKIIGQPNANSRRASPYKPFL